MHNTQKQEALLDFVSFLERYVGSTVNQGDSLYSGLEYALQREVVVHKWEHQDSLKSSLVQLIDLVRSIDSSKIKASQNAKNIGIIGDSSLFLDGILEFLAIFLSSNKCFFIEDEEKLPFYSFLAKQIDPNQEFIFFGKAGARFCSHLCIREHKEITAVQLEYYSKRKHNIIKRKASIAVLSGEETNAELNNLGMDVIHTSGRSKNAVQLILVPKDYDFVNLFDQWQDYSHITNNNRYANNYDYHSSVYLLNKIKHYDTGFVLSMEKNEIFSHTGIVNYNIYNSDTELNEILDQHKENTLKIYTRDHLTSYFGSSKNWLMEEINVFYETLDFIIE